MATTATLTVAQFRDALNAQTGAKLWNYKLGDFLWPGSPAVANGVVYVGSGKDVYALDAATGKLRWKASGVGSDDPAVVNGVVYVVGGNNVYAIGNQPAPTHITLATSNPSPTVNQKVTFTATLKSGTSPLHSKSITIYHYFKGVRYTDATKTTNADGKITFAQSFGSAGPRYYYAAFAGDSQYVKSQAGPVTLTVRKVPTTATLTASKTNPTVYQQVTFTAKLYRWNPATSTWVALAGKPVTIWHMYKGVRYNDITKTTVAGQGHVRPEVWVGRRALLLRYLRK